ncbi:MAG TPA: helix-turn-helix domain-containing protein [Candidatus Thermoplasmatota archaeon]|nr:helix-turn-helix domain-containing protein [Candidatus Thermoplasmatota archaeon]
MTVRRLVVAVLLAALAPGAAAKPMHECDCDHGASPTPAESLVDAASSPGGLAAGVAVAGGLGWVGARRLRGLPLVPPAVAAWTRLGPSDVVRHPTRARLLTLVRERPGAPTADLVIAASLNEATALHHLETLERARFVKSLRVGRDRLWFEAGAERPDAPTLAALHAPTRRELLDAVHRRPGVTQADLARELGLTRATLSHHVRHLRDAGLLQARRDGLRIRLYAVRETDSPRASPDPVPPA